jgi:hypothetical protein
VGKKTTIGGTPVTLVTPEEAEEVDYVVCMPALYANSKFSDNVQGECAKCGCAIAYRPHVPKKPPKVCYECAMILTPKGGGQ